MNYYLFPISSGRIWLICLFRLPLFGPLLLQFHFSLYVLVQVPKQQLPHAIALDKRRAVNEAFQYVHVLSYEVVLALHGQVEVFEHGIQTVLEVVLLHLVNHVSCVEPPVH